MEWLWFDIDTQKDFMLPDGALYVPGAEGIIPNIARLVGVARRRAIPLVSSLDTHVADDPEFKDFPPHCVAGTEGREKIPETLRDDACDLEETDAEGVSEALREGRQILVSKDTFDLFSNPRTSEIVSAGPERVAVFGVATDYCVRACALGCRRRGLLTFLVTDAVAGVEQESTGKAREEMTRAGVSDVTTDELIAMLDARR